MRTIPTLQTEPGTSSSVDLLKAVLENLAVPAHLDNHPWAQSWMVTEECKWNPALRQHPPGMRLAITVALTFRRLLPPAPPRQGKRLDTRWGEFGILASRYFVPFVYGWPYPSSLREAWHGIDEAIQMLVFDGSTEAREDERAAYHLVAEELEAAPESTLSDWHRKGVQRLAGAIDARENARRNSSLLQSSIPLPGTPTPAERALALRPETLRRILTVLVLTLAVVVLAALVWGGFKVRRLYDLAKVVRADAASLQELADSSLDLDAIGQAGPALPALRKDFDRLRAEATSTLWLAPWLSWVPIYGGDLAAAPKLLELSDLLLTTAEHSYAGFSPILAALKDGASVNPEQLTLLLTQAGPELTEARLSFDHLMQIHQGLDLASLSPQLRSGIKAGLDPLLPRLDDGLTAALALPGFLGASSDGPKTYLLLAQNEDELRSTGGFITAVGSLVLQGGEVIDLSFKNSGDLDNWAKPYPPAPWQLQEYMNSPVLVLRDANWFTDFPTTALYAENLYAYTSAHSVDGVIAFDQHLLVLLLQVTGPIQVEGAKELVSAENVISFMRTAKLPPAGQPVPADWSYKGFMDKIASALFRKLFSGDVSWRPLGETLLHGLDEHHLLLQLDDPAMGEVLARHGWNGALQRTSGDFLMVADTNIGFNKTSALVETSLVYDVDLTDLLAPESQLSVLHRNNSSPQVQCKHWIAPRLPGQEKYPLDACYWNYMRLYRPAGTALLEANPQAIPAGWMILGQAVDPRVDLLDEPIEGIQGFGTLMVIPGGESLDTSFIFSLPAGILQVDRGSNELIYGLKVRKQPGTMAIPLTVRVHLPAEAVVRSTSPGGLAEGGTVLFETELTTDLEIRVIFNPR